MFRGSYAAATFPLAKTEPGLRPYAAPPKALEPHDLSSESKPTEIKQQANSRSNLLFRFRNHLEHALEIKTRLR